MLFRSLMNKRDPFTLAKAFLDLAVTLEYLETLGVPVLGWETNEFPAFYLRQSGLEIPRVDSVEEVACLL